MSNRDDLMAAAKQCLREKGFTRTTARDLAAVSGVSLAAIGYHFGSKEALLSQAMIEATAEWVGELETALASEIDPNAPLAIRFETVWTRILEVATANRQLWAANFEVSPYIDAMPEVREVMAAAQEKAREGLAELFQGAVRPDDPAANRAVGAFHYALMTGVLAQWLIDPERAPSARDLTQALRIIAADVAG
ncbi:TetR/AcrR family transcriptional regulator [Phenylobacterium sp.]|jgi:AcrR family transcriptional regulator|uniref:TetR/AcrR family transcriptional regulator n=1 Tax=Phenylobacterium sp. TaxID=1871053 RepID=UPI002E375C98|nr:TetR family transcriptional regulator [Phenylobacterium sp.]HEX3365548.1 TetR family transcriptional regulator [Phenylobacterium sp.]